MSLHHSDTLSWFRTNKSLFLLLKAACLAEKQQIPISVYGLTQPELKPTRGTLTITPLMLLIKGMISNIFSMHVYILVIKL
jgi:hypothetical protein